LVKLWTSLPQLRNVGRSIGAGGKYVGESQIVTNAQAVLRKTNTEQPH